MVTVDQVSGLLAPDWLRSDFRRRQKWLARPRTRVRCSWMMPEPAFPGMSISKLTTAADVRADATAAEAVVTTELPRIAGTAVVAVLIGRALTTHELLPAITSTYRVTTGAGITASRLRDQLVAPFIGTAAPAGANVGTAAEFYLDITTVRRGGSVDIIIAVSPRTPDDDASKATAIRVNDLVNSTGWRRRTRRSTSTARASKPTAIRWPTFVDGRRIRVDGSVSDGAWQHRQCVCKPAQERGRRYACRRRCCW